MLEDAACMSLPLNPKVQGGGDAYLLGFLLGVGIRSKYAEHHPKEMISAQESDRLANIPDSFSITDLTSLAII